MLLVIRKAFLRYPFNGTSSEMVAETVLGRKFVDIVLEVELAHLPSCAYIIQANVVK